MLHKSSRLMRINGNQSNKCKPASEQVVELWEGLGMFKQLVAGVVALALACAAVTRF